MKNALLALAAIAAAALALAACGSSDSGSSTTTPPAATTGAAVEASLAVVGGEPDGGIQTIELNKGQDVKITVTSDQPYEIHLHGYDIAKDAGPDAPAVFAFNATIDGVFEMEVEDTATQIAKLVVNP